MRARAVEHVRRALRTSALRAPEVFARDTRLIVGFSGGQDSTCLLHALAHSHRGLDLLAVHVDHGLRANSAETAQQVVALASSMGITCEIRRVNVVRRGSIQDAARAARYDALASAAAEHQARAVLVAHTADDQAETLLLNLLRGTGLQGLAGMTLDSTLVGCRVVRPLLRISRLTTLAYCTHFGLSIVEDASNLSRAYTRNRVRLDLLPALERFNPAVRRVLARTAELVADDAAALDTIVEALYVAMVRDHTYDLVTFRREPRALQRRLLRRGLAALVGDLADVADAPIEDALDLLQTGQTNQSYHLPYGVELCIGSATFSLLTSGRARQRERQKTWDSEVPRV